MSVSIALHLQVWNSCLQQECCTAIEVCRTGWRLEWWLLLKLPEHTPALHFLFFFPHLQRFFICLPFPFWKWVVVCRLCMCSWFLKEKESILTLSSCKVLHAILFLKAVGWCGNILVACCMLWSVLCLCLVAAARWKNYASGRQWAAFQICVCYCQISPGQPSSCLTAVCHEKGSTGRTKVRIFQLWNGNFRQRSCGIAFNKWSFPMRKFLCNFNLGALLAET